MSDDGSWLTIRAAEQEDLPVLLPMINEGELFPFNDVWGRPSAYDRGFVWVAETEGEIVGTISGGLKQIWLNGDQTWGSYSFHKHVSPGWRRRSIGRYLTEHHHRWYRNQGSRVHFSQISEYNEAQLKLHNALGSRIVETVTYLGLKVREASAPAKSQCAFEIAYNSSSWTGRIQSAFGGRDLAPIRLMDVIYAPLTSGGYIGTLATNIGQGFAWGTLWDKHQALGKAPLNPGDRTIFVCDIVATKSIELVELARGAFVHSNAPRIVLVLRGAGDLQAAATGLADEFNVTIHREHIIVEWGTMVNAPYLDIRD